ncbi:hypothetical protein N7486_000288 [Penicillium sp. IBT 16267x]|nr:hypothetical protein N7486_000288 [Penicillium sp. IBT 16267x]
MAFSFSLRSAVSVAFAYAGVAAGTVYKIPNAPYDGRSKADFLSGLAGLDVPKMSPYPNQTSFEWYYFDVASTSSANESVTVVFYETTADGFIFGPTESLLLASISGTFVNGTPYVVDVPVSTDFFAIITANLNSVSGVWGDSGFSFNNALLSEYTVKIDNAAAGLEGTIVYQSIAPALLPCGPDPPFSSEQVCPHVGWVSAVPASTAIVDLTIGGETIAFTGVGYHDHNWGDRPYVESEESSYWGHAQVGPYSLVWADLIGPDGHEYISSYVARDNILIQASCTAGAVKVRPLAGAYPPKLTDAVPEGYTIEYSLGELGRFQFTTSADLALIDTLGYYRYMGKISGGKVGEEIFEGRVLGEQFAIA